MKLNSKPTLLVAAFLGCALALCLGANIMEKDLPVVTSLNITNNVRMVLDTSATGNVMTAIQTLQSTMGNGYVMTIIGTGALNPAASGTYYIGRLPGVTAGAGTTFTNAAVPIPRSGTIKRVDLRVYVAGTLASAGFATVTHSIDYDAGAASVSINNDSDYAIANVLPKTSGAVSQAVVAGHYLALKLVAPAWSPTAPTAVSYHCQIYIEP